MLKLENCKYLIILVTALALLSIVGASTACLNSGGQCILPIYVLLLQGLGVHPLLFSLSAGAIVFISLRIPKPSNLYMASILFNILTALAGAWWLSRSFQLAHEHIPLRFFLLSIMVFTGVQAACFIWNRRLKSAEDFAFNRAILAILISLNLSWSFMNSFGIR